MDSQQVLEVKVKLAGSFGGVERFYAKMGRDGRVTIPKLPLELLRQGTKRGRHCSRGRS